MRKAKYYTKVTKKSFPYFKKIMNHIEYDIMWSAERGFSRLTVDINDITKQLGISVDECNSTSLRNLVIKELKEKGFVYKLDESVLIIYW